MTLYRPHRGLLADSMKEVAEFNGLAELVDLMRNEVKHFYPDAKLPTVQNTRVEKYGNKIDERIGWDTHIVLVNSEAWGFTNGPVQ